MTPPQLVNVAPPRRATTMFKVVAMVYDTPTSIWDGNTTYPLQQTVMQRVVPGHRGGLYCFRTLEECLARDEAMLPGDSALLQHPRAILRVLAWNDDEDPPVPVTYGGKHAFSYVRAVQIIPMPLSWLALRGLPTSSPTYQQAAMSPRGTAAPLSGAHQHPPSYGAASPPVSPAQVPQAGTRQPSSTESSSMGGAAPRTAVRQSTVTRLAIMPSQHLARRQAQTLQLEMEVAMAEEQLRRALSLTA